MPIGAKMYEAAQKDEPVGEKSNEKDPNKNSKNSDGASKEEPIEGEVVDPDKNSENSDGASDDKSDKKE